MGPLTNSGRVNVTDGCWYTPVESTEGATTWPELVPGPQRSTMSSLFYFETRQPFFFIWSRGLLVFSKISWAGWVPVGQYLTVDGGTSTLETIGHPNLYPALNGRSIRSKRNSKVTLLRNDSKKPLWRPSWRHVIDHRRVIHRPWIFHEQSQRRQRMGARAPRWK